MPAQDTEAREREAVALPSISGVLPALATPFGRDGSVDLGAFERNVIRLMRTRVQGVLVLGTNGEAPYVTAREAVDVVHTARAVVPADRFLLVGTGQESTRETITACLRAAGEGADAVLVRTPSAFASAMTADALVRHYTAVADASPVPVWLYAYQAAFGVLVPVEAVARLAAHPNIVGMKESSGDVSRVARLVCETPAAFSVVVGAAPAVYPSLCMGAVGAVLAVANVVPDLCVALYDAHADGRHADARASQGALEPLARAVTTTYGVPGLKAAMTLVGLEGGCPRSPLTEASPAVVDAIRALLATLEGAVPGSTRLPA